MGARTLINTGLCPACLQRYAYIVGFDPIRCMPCGCPLTAFFPPPPPAAPTPPAGDAER